MTALNPVKTIGEQVAEGIRWHTRASRADAEDRARKMLDRVGLPAAQFPLSRYPHELSGGQRQRVVIAIACALKPKLLIADEPTTALDVVLQAQILDLLRDLVAENRMGLLLISHDLAVVTEMADRITILRHGEVMEAGDTARTLVRAAPSLHAAAGAGLDACAGACQNARGRPRQPPAPGCQTSSSGSQTSSSGRESVTRDYPGRRKSLLQARGPDPRRRRCLVLDRSRPVGGAGRAFRLRQVHACPHGPGAGRADIGNDPVSRRSHHRQERGGAQAGAPQHAGGVPGPLRLLRSAP